jgi:hypothetical protein
LYYHVAWPATLAGRPAAWERDGTQVPLDGSPDAWLCPVRACRADPCPAKSAGHPQARAPRASRTIVESRQT